LTVKIDQVIRTRRKTTLLSVMHDGRVVVRTGLRTSNEAIRRMVEKRADWIRAKQEQFKAIYASFEPKEYVNGEEFWYLGKMYKLEIVEAGSPKLALDGSFRLSRGALQKAPSVFEGWYRQQARIVLPERVEWYAARHGFSYNQVRINSARKRWGSCSSSGTISFPWRLVMAPMEVIDYVVVHELVHSAVHDHSKEFWRRVGLIVPDYKERVRWLNRNGHLLALG
jgi:predicted metal-dependent hydrolase